MRNYVCLILALFILGPMVWCDGQNDQEARIQKLEQVIKDQSQKIEELQKKVGTVESNEQLVREYLNKPEAEDAATVAAGYDGSKGFFIKSGDGNFELYMSGYVQVGLGLFENKSYENNSFFPNGIYLAFDAYLYKGWHARIQLSFADMARGDGFENSAFPGFTYGSSKFFNGKIDGITVQDAFVEYICMPEFQVRVGHTHVPFTMQGQYGSNEGIQIWSEPFVAWSHGRDWGMMFMGTLSDTFEYKLGLFNGENDINHTDDILMAGSIRLYPFKKSENANTFFHVGLMRSRDNNTHFSGNINSASLYTPWGRQVFNGVAAGAAQAVGDQTQGWKTGVDVAFRFEQDLDPEKVNHLRFEAEFMYVTWQRGFAEPPTSLGRLPYLEGYGASIGFSFRHNMTPEVEGAGLFPLFVFSYSDIDNKHTDDFDMGTAGNILGQRVYCYTFGLGYAFNSHVRAAFNWVMVDLDEKDLYGGPKNRADFSDDIENGWFFELTAQW